MLCFCKPSICYLEIIEKHFNADSWLSDFHQRQNKANSVAKIKNTTEAKLCAVFMGAKAGATAALTAAGAANDR